MHKKIGIGMAAFAVIEAVVTFFLVMKPLFINPVYSQCNAYNEEGKTCIVKLFGKTFASEAEIANNQIILSLWDTIVNIILIYLVITGILLVLAFCFYKGFSFAKSYLISVFGAKAVIGMVPLLIPFANLVYRNSIKAFGIIDAVICLVGCVFCVYQNSDEYADDMLFTDEERSAMWKRGITGGIMFAAMAAVTVFTNFALAAYGSLTLQGGNWSIIIGWAGSGNDTSIVQGIVLVLLLGIALIGAIAYTRDGEWALLYFFSFGAAAAVTNLVAIIERVLWVAMTYSPIKACYVSGDVAKYTKMYANANGYNPFAVQGLYNSSGTIDYDKVTSWMGNNAITSKWWIATVFLILACIASAALAVFAFTKIKSKFSFKHSDGEKKPFIALLIGVGSLILSFAVTMVAVLMYDKLLFTYLQFGAMDYMYIILYGGVTLFLAAAMWCGYGFTKFGTLALYILIASNNFSSIFTVFGARTSKIADMARQGYNFAGYNYIICAVVYILSIVLCLGIIAVFVVKEVKDFMYQKRYS